MIRLFLSHASEDKDQFVRPLAEALSGDPNFNVWYDEYELTLGDRLLQKIGQGLASCDYGVVVLSPAFFAKRWPREELEGLFGLETKERKVILPIWKGVSEDDVRGYSPVLANRIGVDSKLGIEKVVSEIKRAVGLVDRYKSVSIPNWKSKFASLDQKLPHERRVKAFSESQEGLVQVEKAAALLVEDAKRKVDELTEAVQTLSFKVEERAWSPMALSVHGPARLVLVLRYSRAYTNTLHGAQPTVSVYRDLRHFASDETKSDILLRRQFGPTFDDNMQVIWVDENQTFTSNQQLLDFAFEELFKEVEKSLTPKS